MPYTADKPGRVPSREELRARIPGWGADLNPADRPAVPRERFDPASSGAHWDLPEQQPELVPRERSVEHARLTPVFGSTYPPRGLSGVMRRRAFAYGEARAAHWLILLAADRVDMVESGLRDLAAGHLPPVLPTGSRRHRWADIALVAGPVALAAAARTRRHRSRS